MGIMIMLRESKQQLFPCYLGLAIVELLSYEGTIKGEEKRESINSRCVGCGMWAEKGMKSSLLEPHLK